MTDHKPCDPADPCSTAYDLASERDTLDGLLSETKDRLDAALAQVARLRASLAAIVARSENGELGTSRTRDMAGLARAALAETDISSATLTASDGWNLWNGGDCPVGPLERVDVRFADGSSLAAERAQTFDWDADDEVAIVAYRIVEARDA